MHAHAGKVARHDRSIATAYNMSGWHPLVAVGLSWLFLHVLYGAVAIAFLPWDQSRVQGLFEPLGTFDYFMDFAVLLSALLSAAIQSRIVSFGVGFFLCLLIGGADLSRYAYSGPGELAAAVRPLMDFRFKLLFAWWPITWALLFIWNRRRLRVQK